MPKVTPAELLKRRETRVDTLTTQLAATTGKGKINIAQQALDSATKARDAQQAIVTGRTKASTGNSATPVAPVVAAPEAKPKQPGIGKLGWQALAYLQGLAPDTPATSRMVVTGLYRQCGQAQGQPVVEAIKRLTQLGYVTRVAAPVEYNTRCTTCVMLNKVGAKQALPAGHQQPVAPDNWVAPAKQY